MLGILIAGILILLTASISGLKSIFVLEVIVAGILIPFIASIKGWMFTDNGVVNNLLTASLNGFTSKLIVGVVGVVVTGVGDGLVILVTLVAKLLITPVRGFKFKVLRRVVINTFKYWVWAIELPANSCNVSLEFLPK